MPIYEFACHKEKKFVEVITRAVPAAGWVPQCPDCGSKKVTRMISRFQFHMSFQSKMDALDPIRAFMYPRVLGPVVAPVSSKCHACPGRLTFVDYDAIPTFAMPDDPPPSRVFAALRTASWLLFLSIAISGLALKSAGWRF